ncbi:hypothetical protein [Methylobacterium nodulans]|uniref:Uncharacterized protein n=1 Tax=Methylobacterium nodulans (strain LMG 21967 / CNCM I-2342 / ORS 2060) TaxID=460265 RepID=B8ISB6_METNO|nr:hypothetical protein [Methylobacterium nodulans]ACL58756.1 hypothetical protein Mnod_3856 [Methylobacterium nodulans ORS 2060]
MGRFKDLGYLVPAVPVRVDTAAADEPDVLAERVLQSFNGASSKYDSLGPLAIGLLTRAPFD